MKIRTFPMQYVQISVYLFKNTLKSEHYDSEILLVNMVTFKRGFHRFNRKGLMALISPLILV